MVTVDSLREVALSLPEVEERPSYGGRPSWRTKTRMFCWFREAPEAPEALVVWVESLDVKEILLQAEPTKFFTTDHYDGHPILLVRLEEIDQDDLEELVTESWRQRAPKTLVKRFDARLGG